MFKGFFLLLAAAFMFALSTVFLKLATTACAVHPAVATFARFSLGFFIFAASLAAHGYSLRPQRPVLVGARSVLNAVAVVLFFAGISLTTVTKSNILNLTYPVFVFFIAPFITGERSRWYHMVFLGTTLAGAWLIVRPETGASLGGINTGDLLCFASGVVAGFAISVLREVRKYDEAEVILFYQMGCGMLLSAMIMLPSFVMPRGPGLRYVIITAALSAAGQFALTVGYRYISAVAGSIVLSSGIFFATILGVLVFHEPLTPSIVAGALLILLSLVGVSGILERSLGRTR